MCRGAAIRLLVSSFPKSNHRDRDAKENLFRVRFTAAVKSSIRSRDDRKRLFVRVRGARKCMHGKGLVIRWKDSCVLCIIQCHWPRTATVLINAENQLVKHSNEKSSTRRADSSRKGSAAEAFGAPRNEFGDGDGNLGSAAAAWLGGWLGGVARRRIRVV